MISWAMRESVLPMASASRTTFPADTLACVKAQAGSQASGRATSFELLSGLTGPGLKEVAVQDCSAPAGRGPEQRGPLVDVQIALGGAAGEAGGSGRALQRERRDDAAEAVCEGMPHEAPILGSEARGHELPLAAHDPQQRRVDVGARLERGRVQTAHERELPPRAPLGCELCARDDGRALEREAPLDDQIRARERNARI